MAILPAELDRTSPGFETAAQRLDEAVVELLRNTAPVTFRLADSETERRAAYRLRYEAVIAQGWGNPSQFPNGLECEPIDDKALHMLAWLNAEVIANCRALLPTPGESLPLEIEYGITVEPAGQVVQIDRICVGGGSGQRHRLLLPWLMAATWIEVRRRGYGVLAGLNTETMLRLYKSIGFEHEILAPAQRSWSDLRYPVRFSPLKVTQRFYDLVSRDTAPRS